MDLSWISLLPTLIVVAIAFTTHNINKAFFGGIATAALIASQGSLLKAISLVRGHIITQITDHDTIMLYLFLISIATIAVIITHTGSGEAFTQKARRYILTKRGVEYTSVLFSILMSVDDYLSILSVGHVIRLLTDQYNIARLRLAYLVHSLAGPLVILVPISSWVATITSQINTAGIDKKSGSLIVGDPFSVYIATIPYIFYSLLIIGTLLYIVHTQYSFNEPLTTDKKHKKNSHKQSSFMGLVAPLATLLITFIVGSLIFENQTFLIMCVSGLLSLSVAYGHGFYTQAISYKHISSFVMQGFQLMQSALLTVFLASILALFLRENLQTGLFLAKLVHANINLTLLPLLFFALSLVCAIATGSAWGTFALMISMAIPMLASLMNGTTITPDDINLLYPVLGAIFSGAVCGDHISPLSETTVMTATSTGTHPLEHAYTQFFYTAPALIGTAIAYGVTGYFSTTLSYWAQSGLSLCIGFTISFICLHFFKKSNSTTFDH